MERDDMMKKLLGGFLIGGLLLGGGGLAMAGNDDASDQSASTVPVHGPRMPGKGMMNTEITRAILESLVSAGTVTQDQTEKIMAQIEERENERLTQKETMQNMTKEERQAARAEHHNSRVDLLNQVVTEGIITQEQADAIQTAMHDKMETQRTEVQESRQTKHDAALSDLVGKGLITTEQSAAIKEKLAILQSPRLIHMQARQKATTEEHQAQREKMQSMTAAERQAFMRAHKPGIANALEEMVTEGTLTQGQAAQVEQAISFLDGHKRMSRGPGSGGGGMRGTVTQAASCQ